MQYLTADKIDVKTLDKDFREYLSRPSNRPLLAWPHVILVTNRERSISSFLMDKEHKTDL
jgi:hypothetical protein